MCESCADNRPAVAEALAAAGRIVAVTHVRPDGDAIGSAAALRLSARAAGKDCRVVVPDTVPQRYAFLLGDEPPAAAADFAALAAEADLVVVVDTCTFAQLEPLAGALGPLREKTVVIDHHATADDVAAIVWRDVSAAAAAVLVTELLESLDWPIPPPAAEALAAAVYTDTGWLRHANTDARALGVITRLLGRGVRPGPLYARLYQSDRPQRLRLLTAALSSLELHAAGRLATMTLTGADFARAGAARDETEDFVNEPMRIGSVEVSVILIERGGDEVRVSLRSKGGVDVAALARGFGGGGHPEAAGCTLEGDIPSAKRRIVAACAAALRGRAGRG